MTRILIACLMCIFSNWCTAEYNYMKPENSLEPVPEIDEKPFTHWKNEKIFNVNDLIIPDKEKKSVRESRSLCSKKKKKKHSKYLVPLLIGWMLIKSILLPIALKALAVLSGKAVVLSFMSLILAAIMGLRRLVQGGNPTNPGMNTGTNLFSSYGKYNRKDFLNNDVHSADVNDSYDYYYNDGHHRR